MQLHTACNILETINVAENVERFSNKAWKFTTNPGASTSREGGNIQPGNSATNGEKGPLLEHLKDARGCH